MEKIIDKVISVLEKLKDSNNGITPLDLAKVIINTPLERFFVKTVQIANKENDRHIDNYDNNL